MNGKNIKICALMLIICWSSLVFMGWFKEDEIVSNEERRPLKQKVVMTKENLLDGSYMKEFENYILDQFPFRNGFRKIKSLVNHYGFHQEDNNGIYMYKNYAGKIDYPLKKASVDFAVGKFENIYETYLKDNSEKIIMAIVPDKGHYMAKESGHLSYDCNVVMEIVEKKIPWAEHVRLLDILELSDYYRTDTHWRQEKIISVAERLSEKLDVTILDNYTYEKMKRDFYGVFYSQGALTMKPDQMVLMNNSLLEQCRVYDYESGKEFPIYNMEKAKGKDMYETYLSGAKALLNIKNPLGKEGKNLIVFRDSFASSLIPLLIKEYSNVTLIDTRYISTEQLKGLVDFKGADVLFIYNTILLNNSSILK